MSLKVSDHFIKQGNGYIWNMGLCYLFLGSRNIRNALVTLNFSFTDLPTSFYEKTNQLIGFCVLNLV